MYVTIAVLDSRVARWSFHGQFQKIWPFLKCAGYEKTHLVILYNLATFLAIFSVCHRKIKFSLNILSFCIFWTVFIFMSLLVLQ